MAKIKKKTAQIPVSLENTLQARDLFDRYHEIAKNLHESTNQAQAEAVEEVHAQLFGRALERGRPVACGSNGLDPLLREVHGRDEGGHRWTPRAK